jgi:polysaccharide biosynthesis protein PslG
MLGADLLAQGRVWQFLYYQTGEETPVAQIRGAIELLGNLIRPQPDTAPLTPIQHKNDIPFGINTFLQKEVEEPKIRAMLQMIRDGGFVWLRQEFPWEDLEVDGRGQFSDTRNDYNGDGLPDTIDAWQKYDRMVNLTAEYGLRLMVRLSNPPDWAIADNPDKGTFAPPDDPQDFVNYAVAVATRYQGRITHYQIWNEPNIYPEWGNQFADPQAYTDLLCRTYRALKAVDPNIVVISAAIAPTISLDGYMGYQDVVYLQNMYDAGAGACFDVLAAQGYGLFSGAYDRRLRPTSVNLARHTYYRDIMVKNGDSHKAIWISEAAWNAVESATLPPTQIADYDRFGIATQAQSARYMPQMLQRAQEEWSWVGNISYWFFTRSDPSEIGQSFYYFRMVEPDYSPEKPTFTPLPVYTSVKEYLTNQTPTLYRGVHQAESWQITRSSDSEIIAVQEAQLGEAVQTRELSFVFSGTDVRLFFAPVPQELADLTITLDGEPIAINGDLSEGIVIFSAFTAKTHTVTLSSSDVFVLDAILVDNREWGNLGILLGVMVISAGVMGVGLWVVRKRTNVLLV